MAKLPTTITIRNSDPDGLYIQNSFNQAVYEAVSGNLTFRENIRCQIKELPFTTLTDYSTGGWSNIEFPCPFKEKPIGLFLLQIYKTLTNEALTGTEVFVSWIFKIGNIVIPWVSGLEDETQYTIRVMVI